MDAIVYTSNTGYTAAYADLLGEKTGLPVYSLKDAGSGIRADAEIIYLGWLMAGNIMGYRKAARRYRIRAVCGVGMAKSGTQLDEARKANKIPAQVPLYTLQGGFDITRLRGIYKLMMTAMAKGVGQKLAAKADKTAEEADMLDMMQHGGSRVCVENLAGLLAWYEKER
ncbi:MAG: hypothetical protein VB111_02990 [Clostridiaceae bacterium]|nr:hypothetical protein [Clostridiaceae bacterium]